MSGVPSGVEVARPLSTGADDPDWALLARVARGDGEAFEPLVERHQDRLVRLCERLLGDAEEARDAAQEVFVKAFRHAGRAEPRGQLFTWLYRIAVNHCLNRMRRRRIARFFSLSGAGEGEETPAFDPPSEGASPERELEQRERWLATRRAIDALPESQRTVLLLAKFEGLAYREIAEVLGISLGAVESRLVRAMRKLTAAQEGAGVGVPEEGVER
ncbi:MAG: sigma-70 family RNA polymerase sigma factor [Holophagales bacterium]|nr:sigma-70 family RNA polymerase sigma factor [Holophagales bacterium]